MKTCAFAVIQHDPHNKYKSAWLQAKYGNPVLRIDEIDIAIKSAENNIASQTAPDIKIAICPEHFLAKQHGFDPNETTNPSFFHEIGEIIPIFQKLKILSDKYPDWLIIPGSITIFGLQRVLGSNFESGMLFNNESIHKTSHVSGEAHATNSSLHEKLIQRTAAIKSQETTEFRPCYNISPIYLDGKIIKLRKKRYEAFDENKSLELVGAGTENAFFPMSNGSPIIQYKGLNIGIEICAEHEHGLLLAEAGRKLDLHIIISNEVSPFREHTALAAGGRLIHVGSSMTGIYRNIDIPESTDSDGFEYSNFRKPGIYTFRETIGEP